MAFCKYCGTQYPDGGACTNPACTGANQTPAVNPSVNPFAPQGEPSSQPPKKSSKGVLIALALVVVLIIAAVVVLVLLLSNKKKEEEKKKADSHKSAVELYAESMYDKNGLADYSEITMLEDVFKEYKKSGEFDDDKEDYKESISELKEEGIEDFSVDSIKKQDKLSEDALDAAEEYFEEQAEEYDVDIDDIEVSDGYDYKIKFEYKEDGEKETYTEYVCAVKVKGDGWKIIEFSAEDLEYYYG